MTGLLLQRLCMQVLKVVFPVYYGAQYQVIKMPRHAVIKALKAQQNEKLMKGPQTVRPISEKPSLAGEATGGRKADGPQRRHSERS